MTALPHKGKKGVSLAYVIVAAMVLLIFSGVLVSAAVRDVNLTSVSTQSRQAYLTVKSAVEYAEGEAYREYEAGTLSAFSVAPNGNTDPFKRVETADPDGETVYAKCTVGDDGLVTVSGKVAYDSGRYRSLGCTFQLTEKEGSGSGIGAINSYVAAGQRYGNSGQFLNGDYSFNGRASRFPAVFQEKISTSNQPFAAPEMYFLESGESLLFKGGGSWRTTLTSDVFYFAGDIRSESDNTNASVILSTYNNEKNGVLWFGEDTEIQTPSRTVTLSAGAYYFKDGTNLLDARLESRLTKIPDDDFTKDKPLRNLSEKVAYYEENTGRIASSEKDGGIGWTDAGRLLNGAPAPEPDQDIFLYADKSVYFERWRNQNSPQTFEARSIVLYYNGESDTPFTIPNTAVTFQADTLWLNAQSEDGSPEDDTGDDDVFAVKQAFATSRFYLKSTDEKTSVTVYLPHGLIVKNAAGKTLYTVFKGAYSVESGTDLFQSNPDAFTPISWETGSGGSGEGGATVSDLVYTDS